MHPELTIPKIIYGFLYSALVAGAYLFARVFGAGDGGLTLFCTLCWMGFAIHLFVFPKVTLRGLRNRKMLLRGLLYGATQTLLFRAQAHGQTSVALLASVAGVVVGTAGARFWLDEKVTYLNMLAILLCLSAGLFTPQLATQTYWAIAGGLLQGTGFVLSRSLMVQGEMKRESISTGLFYGGLIALGAHAVWPNPAFSALAPKAIVLGTAIILGVQYGFFILYSMLSTVHASTATLSRIPWSVLLEGVFLGRIAPAAQLASSALVLAGAMIQIFEADKKQRTKA